MLFYFMSFDFSLVDFGCCLVVDSGERELDFIPMI